jgi:hypothetical protein
MIWFALLMGCSRQRQLAPPDECNDPQLIRCLQPLAFETLSASALARVQREGEACFSKDKAVLGRQSSCLPLVMGEDAQGRGKVSMRYYCTDICPDRGGVVAEFEGPRSLEACCAADGQPVLNFAWGGGFRSCVVPRGSNPRRLCQTTKD